MWNVNGAYAFHAYDSGAAAVTGMDITPATAEFHSLNATRNNAVRFVQGDIDSQTTLDAIGPHDLVFCSGVLYHVPDPIHTIEQLRKICRSTLILDSATIPEREEPNAAIFFPTLDTATRQRLTFETPHAKVGLDSDFDTEKGYSNWFWGMTPSCVQALAVVAGFEVVESYVFRRVVTLVCRPSLQVAY